MNTGREPAHLQLIERIFAERKAWDQVERRLALYPSIRAHFPLDLLRRMHGRLPFGVHYMAWRLGVWRTEEQFGLIDRLLSHSAAIPGWEGEISLLSSSDFGTFWSLMWQMQVARFLADKGEVRWLGGKGPDLCVVVSGVETAVECYCYRKKFEVLDFAHDLARQLDDDLRLDHNLAMPIAFEGDKRDFLDRLFRPLLDPRRLEEAKSKARERWPVDLPLPPGTKNLFFYVEGPGDSEFMPSLERGRVGEPETYLKVALTEAISAKAGANRLRHHHNNVVAINMLPSPDFFISADSQRHLGITEPAIALPIDTHLATISYCGIDNERATFRFGCANGLSHPGIMLFGLDGPPDAHRSL
ncbi:MAG: hypothetical protein NXI31_09110 [bacterium]|nr:hypothetical protein [bacterium]